MFNRIREFLRGSVEKPKSGPDSARTAPLGDLLEPADQPLPDSGDAYQLVFATAHSVGVQRESNEDTLFAVSGVLAERETELSVGIFAVADGMGGHEFGELASSCAARVVGQHVIEQLYLPVLDPGIKKPEQSIQEILSKAVQLANDEVAARAPGGGTTLTAAIVVGEQMTIAHVGDSRAYIIHDDGNMEQLTMDHSMVRRLQELGHISAEEAERHPQRNVLYRALGQPEPIIPDLQSFPFPRPGVLLLCTDGLWGVLSDDTIRQIITGKPIWKASRALIAAANEAGGPDNISVILARYH